MNTYLAHHGILGMKWGIRRYQNADGTLTEAGKKRYTKMDSAEYERKAKRNTMKTAATAASAYGVRSLAKGVSADMNRKVETTWRNASEKLRDDPTYRKLLDRYVNELSISDDFSRASSSIQRSIDQLHEMADEAHRGIFRTVDDKLMGLGVEPPAGYMNGGQDVRNAVNQMYRAAAADLERIRESISDSSIKSANRLAVRSNDASAFRSQYLREASSQASQYASIARAAATVAGIVSGVGAVTTIGFGAIAAGQLAYSAYLKHQTNKSPK